MSRLRNQSFTLCLLAAALLAFLAPELGAKGGPLKTEILTKVCVAIAFFFQGLSLHTRKMIDSALNLRVHVFCQLSIFLLSPLLMLALLQSIGSWIDPSIRSGLLFLSIIPTTVSSSIILTSSSDGDASLALFNATLANIAAVFITPLWCLQLFNQNTSELPPIEALVAKISLLVLLPIILGQCLRPFIKEKIENSKTFLKRASNGIIIFVVYVAFCNSAIDGIWNASSTRSLIEIGIVSILFMLLLHLVVWISSPLASKKMDQRIATLFCGAQKSLMAGVPMAAIIFGGTASSENAALLILPLMLYHSFQLFLAGGLIHTFQQKVLKQKSQAA